MFFFLYQYFKRISPRIKGGLFKLLYSSKHLKIGKNFCCDNFPSFIIEKNCKVEIGDNVIFRRNIEIRSHVNSIIIISNNVKLDRGIRLLATNNSTITISDNSKIGLYTVFNGGDSIFIGKKCLISGFVYLQTSMHKHEGNKNVQEQGFNHKPIKLEDDVWIGTHAVIFPGVTLGKGSIVGSNAVVIKSVEDFKVVGGVPAKIINER